MKKAILLLVAFVGMVACGKDDANGTEGGDISTARFMPPKWIQGSWTTNNKQFGYAFKNDDFCQITLGNTNCFKEKNLPVTNIKDLKTNNTYKVSYKIGSSEQVFVFEKEGGNKIRVTHNGRVEGSYTKQ
jgi:hypothetical protein